MKKIKSKLMRVTFLAGAISLMMCGNIFAASTGQIKVGSGSASGWVYGYNSVSGNGTSGYYAESSTSFTALGSACGGVSASVQMTVKSGSSTLYSNRDTVSASTVYGNTVEASLHSGFFSANNITSTSTHTLSGPITFSRTLVAKW